MGIMSGNEVDCWLHAPLSSYPLVMGGRQEFLITPNLAEGRWHLPVKEKDLEHVEMKKK